MICPKCKELGQKSTIYGDGSFTTTAAYYQPFYDEDGKYHFHNGNRSTAIYNCSKGHKITLLSSNKCFNCDFGHDETITAKDIPNSDLKMVNLTGILSVFNKGE